MSFGRPVCSVWGVMLLVACCVTAAEKAESALTDVLEAWETSTESLWSYDVYIREETVYAMKSVIVGKTASKGKAPPGFPVQERPRYEMRERPPGESPEKKVRFSRQVMSKDGKRRYELWKPKSSSWMEAAVFDGEIVRSMSSRGMTTANTHGRGPDTKNMTSPDRNYAGLYRDAPYGGSLTKLLRFRQGTRLVEDSDDNPSYVHIESPPPEEEEYYPHYGWRVALDPAHGMMPVEIEFFRDTMKGAALRTTVKEFHQVEPGVWAPVKAAYEWVNSTGRIVTAVNLAVDMDRSSWNQPVSEELFTLVIPEGTRVVDDTRNIAFVAGKGDTGKNLDRLIENARNVVPMRRRTAAGLPPSSSRVRLAFVVGINVLVIVAILGILYVRSRRRRRLRRA